jgi:hypothetical protein
MLVVSGVTARMAGMVGIGCRRQEWHEKQRKQYCHDPHAIHGDPLALMDAGRSALAVASLVGEGRLQITFLEALPLTAHNKESSCAPGVGSGLRRVGVAIANSKGRVRGPLAAPW